MCNLQEICRNIMKDTEMWSTARKSSKLKLKINLSSSKPWLIFWYRGIILPNIIWGLSRIANIRIPILVFVSYKPPRFIPATPTWPKSKRSPASIRPTNERDAACWPDSRADLGRKNPRWPGGAVHQTWNWVVVTIFLNYFPPLSTWGFMIWSNLTSVLVQMGGEKPPTSETVILWFQIPFIRKMWAMR